MNYLSAWALFFCSLVRALLRFSFFDLIKMTFEMVSFDIQALLCCFFRPSISSLASVHTLFKISQIASIVSPRSCISWRAWYLFPVVIENCWAIKGSFSELMSYFTLFATYLPNRFSFSCSLPTRRWWSELASEPLITLTSSSGF